MRKFFLIWAIIILQFVFFGCGFDSDKKYNDVNETFASEKYYTGKLERAVFNEENIFLYAQAIHYYDRFDFSFDPNRNYDGHVKIEKNLTPDYTGSLKYSFDHYYDYRLESYISGKAALNISRKSGSFYNISAKMDLRYDSFDNNVTFDVDTDILNSAFGDSNRDESVSEIDVNRFFIYDGLRDVMMDFREVKSNSNEYNTTDRGRVYLGSDGYVTFDGYNGSYTLTDANNQTLLIRYDNRHGKLVVSYQSSKQTKEYSYYYNALQLRDKPYATFDTLYLSQGREFDNPDMQIIYTLKPDISVKERCVWYVNDQKIDGVEGLSLPRKYFKANDKIDVLFILDHQGSVIVKKLETYARSQKPLFKIDSNSFDRVNFPVNDLKFKMDVLKVINPDNGSFSVNWRSDSPDLKFVDGSENELIPQIEVKDYGVYDLSVDVTDENNYTIYSNGFHLNAYPDIFQHRYFPYKEELLYKNIKEIAATDLNLDGLEDILLLANEGYSKDKIVVLYQESNATFESFRTVTVKDLSEYKFNNLMTVDDLNNDGLDDIVLSQLYGGLSGKIQLYIFYQQDDHTFKEPQIVPVYGRLFEIKAIKTLYFNSDNKKDIVLLVEDGVKDKRRLYFALQGKEGFFTTIDIIDEDYSEDSKLEVIDGPDKENPRIFVVNRNYDLNTQKTYYELITYATINGTIERNSYIFIKDTKNTDFNLNQFTFCDLNADGRKDFLFVVNDFLTGKRKWQVMYAEGRTFNAPQPVKSMYVDSYPRLLSEGDFNGDGNIDILTASSRSVNISYYLNGGYHLYKNALFYSGYSSGFDALSKSLLVKDLNHDGKDDVVTVTDEEVVVIGISK